MIKDKLGDLRKKALNKEIALTKFLDFNDQVDIKALDDHYTHVHLYGGYNDAERKRAIIINNEKEIYDSFYQISIIEASFDKRYSNITHRHVLGTIMNLGIDRSTFGDIIVSDQTITIFVCNEILDYLLLNLTEIYNQRTTFKVVKNYIDTNTEIKERIITVPSLRLDAVVSKSTNKGRNEASDLINAGLVLVNHLPCQNVCKQVKEKDILSIRKYGRIIIKEILNTTKKDRIALKIEIKH